MKSGRIVRARLNDGETKEEYDTYTQELASGIAVNNQVLLIVDSKRKEVFTYNLSLRRKVVNYGSLCLQFNFSVQFLH